VTGASSSGASSGGSSSGSGSGSDGGDAGASVFDQRYCEILVGALQGTNVHIDVYSTEGLNDCPEASWSALSTSTIKSQTMATVVLLNGPRYWTIDSLAGSSLLDPMVQSFQGLAVRQAGAIDVPVADVAMVDKPYTQHTIQRQSEFHWFAGTTVHELTDPTGHVYDMQSYSVQAHAQTLATLPMLAQQLTLPTGWSFASRVLTADLDLVATNGTATVVQDDYSNTYLMSK
jgi:hypothetical protein